MKETKTETKPIPKKVEKTALTSEQAKKLRDELQLHKETHNETVQV